MRPLPLALRTSLGFRSTLLLTVLLLVWPPQVQAQNQALHFQANTSSVECPGTYFGGTRPSAFTIEWWHQFDAFNTLNNVGARNTDGVIGWDNKVFTFRLRNANPDVRVGRGKNNRMTKTTLGLVKGTWHHIAYTHDGTTARFYLDGEQVGSKAYPISSAKMAH